MMPSLNIASKVPRIMPVEDFSLVGLFLFTVRFCVLPVLYEVEGESLRTEDGT